MSIWKTLSEDVKNSVRFFIEQGAEVIFVDETTQKHRIALCEGCESFNETTRQCKICKCFMDIKTRLKYDPVESAKGLKKVNTHCPILNW